MVVDLQLVQGPFRETEPVEHALVIRFPPKTQTLFDFVNVHKRRLAPTFPEDAALGMYTGRHP